MLSHKQSAVLDILPLSPPGGTRFGRLRRVVTAVVLLPLACQPFSRADRMPVDPEVRTALRATGEANVIIALVPPPGYGDPTADPDRVRAEIARMQQEVVESLGPANFRDRRRFASVPAMAGTLLTERGLEILLSHRHVRRVDLDIGGTGTG